MLSPTKKADENPSAFVKIYVWFNRLKDRKLTAIFITDSHNLYSKYLSSPKPQDAH